MHEERNLELSASSSIKPILVVTGALVGLLLLICGGAAGYVALTAPAQTATVPKDSPPEYPEHLQKLIEKKATTKAIPFTDDAVLVKKIAATIFKIDFPTDFEPIEALQEGSVRRAVFGKQTENAALLKMAVTGAQFPDVTGVISSDDPIGRQVLKIAESENGRTDTILKATREKVQPRHRELTVLGQRAVFAFRQGKRVSDSKPVWKVWGAFGSINEPAALIFVVPESEFDEKAVVRMIESIRPGHEDKLDVDPESAPRLTQPDKSDATSDKAANPD